MNTKRFEKRVKILMLLHDDNITSLAKKLCIDEATLGKYIHGRRNPPIHILEDIADEYGVSVDFVLGRRGHFTAVDERRLKDYIDAPTKDLLDAPPISVPLLTTSKLLRGDFE